MKTVIATIAIVAAVTAAIDYRINNSVSGVIKESEYRNIAVIKLRKDMDKMTDKVSRLETDQSNSQKQIDGNSDFVDHFTYVEKYPIQINTIKEEMKMLNYKIGER
jgi:hypothetical protein